MESLQGLQRSWVWTVLWLSLPGTALGPCHTNRGELEEGICRIWHGSVFFVVFKIFEGFLCFCFFFYLSEMPGVCVWAGRLSTCFWVFQQTVFWCGGTGVNLNSANWEGSQSPGQSSQEGKVAPALWVLQVFAPSFGLWFGQENKGITSGLHPEVNINQVIPDRRNKTTHLV